MYDALNDSVVPKKIQKKVPRATVSKPTEKADELQTINFADLDNIAPVAAPEIKPQAAELPLTFELQPFEDDDELLLQLIRENPSGNALVPTTSNVNITATNNTMTTSMPVIPKMYFPHSNVTINYNFSK